MFGSFQPEEERPTYGLTKNLDTFNPFIVAFKTWYLLFKKAIHSGSARNFFSYFIKPPGWSHDGSSKTTRQMVAEQEANQLAEFSVFNEN